MPTRRHIHEEEFPIPAEEMFEILIKPSAIRIWWQASRAIILPEKDGIWAGAWGANEDDPDYISTFTIKEYEPPRRILLTDSKYSSKDGELPFEADFKTEFTVEPTESGCKLRVVQDGFPADSVADEFYAGCEVGWRDTFKGIRDYFKAG